MRVSHAGKAGIFSAVCLCVLVCMRVCVHKISDVKTFFIIF